MRCSISGRRPARVMVSYVPGALGGAITNCAHLRTTDGSIDLQACDTQTIAPAPAVHTRDSGCGWKSGDVITYSQDLWGSLDHPSPRRSSPTNFFTVFPAAGVEIGLSGAARISSVSFRARKRFSTIFRRLELPMRSDADLLNPISTSAGWFAGHVLALQLDVSFADAGLLGRSSYTPASADLRLCGVTDHAAVQWPHRAPDVLAALNAALGGGNNPYSYYEQRAALTERRDAIVREWQRRARLRSSTS